MNWRKQSEAVRVNRRISCSAKSDPDVSEDSKAVKNGSTNDFRTPQPKRATRARRLSDLKEANQDWMKFMTENWEPDVKEKELLRMTWSDEFESLYQLGHDIYCYIFNNTPSCKQLFPWIIRYEEIGKDWKESKEFRSQALKFVQTIAYVVKNIYHMERLESFLYGIGQRHVAFSARGFRPEHWNVFQDAMEHALTNRMETHMSLSEEEKKDAISVWRAIALYIISHMKHGYFDGLKKVNIFEKVEPVV